MKITNFNISLQQRIILIFSIIYLLFLSIMIAVYLFGIPFTSLHGEIAATRSKVINDMEITSNLINQRISGWFQERRTDVEVLTASPFFRLAIENQTQQNNHYLDSELKSFVAINSGFDSIALLNPINGALIFGNGDFASIHEAMDISIDKQLFAKITTPGYIQLSTLHHHADNNKLYFQIIHQVFSAENPNKIIAVLVAEKNITQTVRELVYLDNNNLLQSWKFIVASKFGGFVENFSDSFSRIDENDKLDQKIIKLTPVSLALSGINGPYQGPDQNGHTILAFHRQIRIDGDISLAFALVEDNSVVIKKLNEVLVPQALLWLFLLVTGLAVCVVFVRQITIPINKLVLVAKQIESGDFTARAVVTNHSEINKLATVFNNMVAKIQEWQTELENKIKDREEANKKLQELFVQTQKMESIGRLAGGIAHDFNNLLTVILCYAKVIEDETVQSNNPALYKNILAISNAAKRSAGLTNQLLAFARKQVVLPRVIYPHETIAKMVLMLGRLIGENITLELKSGTDIWPINIDPSQLDQILANLCVNAKDAIKNIGKITIELKNITIDMAYCDKYVDGKPGDFVMLSITDTGCGMDNDTQKNIFEPFFTTKEIGKGTGLGLATVYDAIKHNNGFIRVYSELSHGTVFHIYLPRYTGSDISTNNDDIIKHIPHGNETILLVEDEPELLNVGKILLEDLGYRVLTALLPSEAIRVAKEHKGEISLLITDVIMPEMNGLDLLKQLLLLESNIKCLFMSGYTADIIANSGISNTYAHFLQKPFSKHDLALKVREVILNKTTNKHGGVNE